MLRQNSKTLTPMYHVGQVPNPQPTAAKADTENELDMYRHFRTTRSKMITYEMLQQCFHMPISEVAKRLGICLTLLKKICRKFDIKKWPHRQIRKIDNCIVRLQSAMHNRTTYERGLFLEQIDALHRMRASVLKNPNGQHSLPEAGGYPPHNGESFSHSYHPFIHRKC